MNPPVEDSSTRFLQGFGLLAGSFLAGLSLFVLMAARVAPGSGGAEVLVSLFFLAAAASWMRKLGRRLLSGLILVWLMTLGWKLFHASRLAHCRANLIALDAAVTRYVTDHHQPPARLSDLVDRYLPRLPECPSAGRETYSEGYRPDPRRLSCAGANHPGHGAGDYPALIADTDQASPGAPPTMRWASPSRNVSSSS